MHPVVDLTDSIIFHFHHLYEWYMTVHDSTNHLTVH